MFVLRLLYNKDPRTLSRQSTYTKEENIDNWQLAFFSPSLIIAEFSFIPAAPSSNTDLLIQQQVSTQMENIDGSLLLGWMHC
jgi:hypothetical protein